MIIITIVSISIIIISSSSNRRSSIKNRLTQLMMRMIVVAPLKSWFKEKERN